MAENEPLDQGTVWWPAGLAGQESVRVVFNQALAQKPSTVTLTDFDTREPLAAELVAVEESGTRSFARWTAAVVRIAKPEEQGRPFRWRAFA